MQCGLHVTTWCSRWATHRLLSVHVLEDPQVTCWWPDVEATHWKTHRSPVGGLMPKPHTGLSVHMLEDPLVTCWWPDAEATHWKTHRSTVGGLMPKPHTGWPTGQLLVAWCRSHTLEDPQVNCWWPDAEWNVWSVWTTSCLNQLHQTTDAPDGHTLSVMQR